MLLKKLNSIKKYKKFQGWKSQFLSRLEQFLYQEGMVPAETACNEFDKLLTKFVKSANKVQDCIDNGQLSDGKKTVRASLALNEMCNSLTVVNSETESLVPGRSQEERKAGFTKFHVGAALIRQVSCTQFEVGCRLTTDCELERVSVVCCAIHRASISTSP